MDTLQKTTPSRGGLRGLALTRGILARDQTNYRAARLSFRRLFESAPDAMVLANAQGRIILINTQTEQLFGYSRNELIGNQVEMLMPARFREGHAGHRFSELPDPGIQLIDVSDDLYGLK